MWAIGAVLGFVTGRSIHPEVGLPGAIAGGLIGWWLERRRAAAPSVSALLDRLHRIEAQLAAVEKEMRLRKEPEAPELPIASVDQRATDSPPESIPALSDPATLLAQARDPAAVLRAIDEFPPAASEQAAAGAGRDAAPPPGSFPGGKVPAWIQGLWLGNPLAKVGIVLLFFGLASGLKLAAEHGLIPVPLRLLLAAALGIGLITVGASRVRASAKPEHRPFGLALQGGGFAVMYLVGYFMLARYAMIDEGMAFSVFALIGVACTLMAARQDGPALAVLGLSGAFLAPVLAGARADSPTGLFAYFTLLNAFIIGVDWFKSWRVLNIAGFIFTLAIGMVWATEAYAPQHHAVTQGFLVLFLVAYSATPVATALLRAPGLKGWQDGILLFGTPLVGAFLQSRLMEGTEYGLAWSALLGSLWYFGLWALLARRLVPEIRLIERSHLGIAMVLLTVAVPLAFGAQVTSAFWAAEGTAVLWFGVRTRGVWAQRTGLAMQLAAGIALILGWQDLGHQPPIANDAMFGALLLTLAGLLSARLLRSMAHDIRLSPAIPLVWALLWWLGAGVDEIERFTPAANHPSHGLLLVAATVIGLERLSRLWNWPQVRAGAILLLAGMWLAALQAIDRMDHPLGGLMVVALPAALALHWRLLARHEASPAAPMSRLRHVGAWWLILIVLPTELSWHATRMAPDVPLWPFVAWCLALASGVALPVLGRDRIWPFSSSHYLPLGVGLPAVALAGLLAWGNVHLTGATGQAELPYAPVFSFFDISALAGLGALLALARAIDRAHRRLAWAIVLALGFLWLSMLAGRVAHHWGGIPFELASMLRSTLFQAVLTMSWTLAAITAMISGSRHALRHVWLGGFSLLGIVGAKLLLVDATGRGTVAWTITLLGVAVLVLAASYFSPMPPRAKAVDRGALGM